jgi:uncharacterized membrane protein YeaQ/YmgE (transglycosylase-associated protein family)
MIIISKEIMHQRDSKIKILMEIIMGIIGMVDLDILAH